MIPCYQYRTLVRWVYFGKMAISVPSKDTLFLSCKKNACKNINPLIWEIRDGIIQNDALCICRLQVFLLWCMSLLFFFLQCSLGQRVQFSGRQWVHGGFNREFCKFILIQLISGDHYTLDVYNYKCSWSCSIPQHPVDSTFVLHPTVRLVGRKGIVYS